MVPPQRPTPKDRPAPHCSGGMNSQVGESLVGLCHQGWRSLAEEQPRALHEVERLPSSRDALRLSCSLPHSLVLIPCFPQVIKDHSIR